MMRNILSRWVGKPALFLILLWIFHAVLLTSWLKRDERPPAWDQSVHVADALTIRQALPDGNLKDLLIPKKWSGHPPYPPLGHWAMAAGQVVGSWMGFSVEDGATLSHLLFLVLLLWGSYQLGRHWWGEGAGVCAAFLTSLNFPVLYTMRENLIDFPLLSMVVFAYALWVTRNRFRPGQFPILWGVTFACGMLVKGTFFLYLIPVYAEVVGRWFQNPPFKKRQVGMSLLIALILIAPWYLPNLISMIPKVARSWTAGKAEGDPSVLSLASLFWYFNSIRIDFSLVGTLLGFSSLAWLIYKRHPAGKVLVPWFVIGYIFWTIVLNKNGRYILPVQIILPLAVAGLPVHIPKMIAGALVLYAGFFNWWPGQTAFNYPAVSGQWPLEDIVQKAELERDRFFPNAKFLVLANHASLNGNTMRWIAEKSGFGESLIMKSSPDRLGQFTEFVLIKTGDMGFPLTRKRYEAAREEALQPGGWFQKSFTQLGEWPLPDQSQAVLYQCRLKTSPETEKPAGLPDHLLPGWRFVNPVVKSRPSDQFPGERMWTIQASTVVIQGLVFEDVEMTLDGVVMKSVGAENFRVLKLRRLSIHTAVMRQETVEGYLSKKFKTIKKPNVQFFENQIIDINGQLGIFPIQLKFYVDSPRKTENIFNHDLLIKFFGFKLGPIKWNYAYNWRCVLSPGRSLPYFIDLGGIKSKKVSAKDSFHLSIGAY